MQPAKESCSDPGRNVKKLSGEQSWDTSSAEKQGQ